MKRTFLATLILFYAGITVAADTKVPKFYAPKHQIYRKGWIDLNKNGQKDIYEDPSQPIEKRINDLLSQMTSDEKTCQMVTLYGYKRILADPQPTPDWKQKLWKDGLGAMDEQLNGYGYNTNAPEAAAFTWPASAHAFALNEIQKFFIEETRLGIPVDFTNEGIRGVESFKATNFPHPIGLGHTWNRELIHRIGYITGREAALLGYTNIYAPILDVGRDQRWGRYEEIFSESPYLVAELGIQLARGIQTELQVAATAKHFLGYSNGKGAREGMARNDPQFAPREMENIHAYPFERVIREADILGIMCAYNDYDAIPVASSSYWLTERLRKQMGFRGYVVSDSDALEFLLEKHATAEDMEDAVYQAVIAGMNVRCTFRTPESFVLPLRELLRKGRLSMDIIDERVRDILRVKFLTGSFDAPYQTDLQRADEEVNSLEHQKVALQASLESIVLLKNQNELLPLDRNRLTTIAVSGPNAAEKSFALARYGPNHVNVISVLEGIKDKTRGQVDIKYSKGCDLVDAMWPESELFPAPLTAQEEQEIAKAVEDARQSDVAIVVLGGGTRTCGENKSRSSLDLPGRQVNLLQAIVATGKPVILVLINGRPLTINWADRHVQAILEAWYPGAQGGRALADVIFGDYNPGGKLTVTFPKSVGQIPFNFPFKPSSQSDGGNTNGLRGNASRANGALYPFGFGLSYTAFEYANLRLSAANLSPQQSLTVTCDITNTGKRAGEEVVQLYTRDLVSSVTTYEKNLRGFERIRLAPGETKKVSFRLLPRDLQLLNRDNLWVVEPGEFKVMIGASSEDIRLEEKFIVSEVKSVDVIGHIE